MKRLDILRIVIELVFIFNSITVALSQNYRVIEIDSVEYYGAKCGFEYECLFLEYMHIHDYAIDNFLYQIVERDDKARDCYLEEIMPDGWYSHDFSCVNFDNSIIMFLQFETPFESFSYAAAKKSGTDTSISYTKINSAPIMISKNGYIAGFEDTVDAYYTDFKIYKMIVSNREDLDITELFSYKSLQDDSWQVSRSSFPVFWKNDTLYIEGVRLRESTGNTHFREPCYFKAVPK